MKKLFTLMAAMVALCVSAQVNSTHVQLSPATHGTDQGNTWGFINTSITLSNTSGKNWGTNDNYNNAGADTIKTSLMKLSRGVNFSINLPADSAVVRIDFTAVSNSSAAMNWDYLAYLNNGSDWVIFSQEGGQTQITDNETIKKFTYPISPMAADACKAPFASFSDKEGWFTTLNFYIDGNNQVGMIIDLFLVAEKDLANYDPEKDTTTGISRIVMDDENAPMYNIFGQKVTESYKGLVIKNGKKYLLND